MEIITQTCYNHTNSSEFCHKDGKRFDVLKVVLAIFIVAIHTTPWYFPLRPLLRLAVPLFFILSSYFFFIKQSTLSQEEDKKNALKTFIFRYLKLYGFWFVALLPITIIVKKWYINPGIDTLISMIRCFLFSSTFRASWFLMATLINVVIIWYVSKKISDIWLILLGGIFYAVCCLFSNYYYIIDNPSVIELYNTYTSFVSEPFNSFPVAMLFVMFGKILAEKKIYIPQLITSIIILTSFALLYLEYYVVNYYHLARKDDSFFVLVPLSFFVFVFIGQMKWSTNNDTKILRKASTIVYCCHCSYSSVINYALESLNIESPIIFTIALFSVTLICSVITFIVICKIEKRPHFHFFKYAH